MSHTDHRTLARTLAVAASAIALTLATVTPAHATLAQDSFANAPEIDKGGWPVDVDNSAATLEADEPQPTCGRDGAGIGRTTWVKYTHDSPAAVAALWEENLSEWGTPGHEDDDWFWAVWEGASLSSLTQVACSDDDPRLDNLRPNWVQWDAQTGHFYYIQLGGHVSGDVAWAGEQDARFDVAFVSGPGALPGQEQEWVRSGTALSWEVEGLVGGCSLDAVERDCGSFTDLLLPEGVHKVEAAIGRSGTGSWRAARSRTIGVDGSVPSVDLSQYGDTAASAPTFRIAASDALSGIASLACTLDGTTIPCDDDFAVGTMPVGTHTLVATATDRVGLTSVDTLGFTVPVATTPPPPSVTPAPATGQVRATGRSPRRGVAKLKVKVMADGTLLPGARVVVKDGRKIVRRVTLTSGSRRILLTGLKPGKHRFTVVFKGTASVTAASDRIALRVQD